MLMLSFVLFVMEGRGAFSFTFFSFTSVCDTYLRDSTSEGERKEGKIKALKADINHGAGYQLGLLEPKPYVAKMREAAKQLADAARKVTAETPAEVVARK